jgi:hypothetical protein
VDNVTFSKTLDAGHTLPHVRKFQIPVQVFGTTADAERDKITLVKCKGKANPRTDHESPEER